MSDDEWSDDCVWEEDEPLVLTRQISYEVLSEQEIIKRQAQAIEKLADEFGFSYTQSAVLLIQNQWNPQQVIDKLMNNSLEIPSFTRSPSKTLESQESVLCLLCYKTYPGRLMISPECNHAFCEICYQEFLKEAVLAGPECIFTKCPQDPCTTIIPQELFQRLIPPKLYSRYKTFIFRSYVDKNANIKWCPSPGCNNAAVYPKRQEREIDCFCGYSWCFRCGLESHRPLNCEMMAKWNLKSVSDNNDQWLKANTKKCPKCQNSIQKNLGCMHMTCRCGHQFCWLCQGDWSDHSDRTGGNYACNIFQYNQRKGLYEKEEKERSIAALSVQRYEHYFNRFMNHKASLKQAQEKLQRINESVQGLYQVIQEGTLFDFFKEAAEVIFHAKKSLSYSYALGYYLTSVVKIRFYEFIQGELESSVIKLDIRTDMQLDSFIEEINSRVVLSPNFADFRSSTIDLTRVVRNHFEECLKQMESGFPNIKESAEDSDENDLIRATFSLNMIDKWLCGACTFANELTAKKCAVCSTARPINP